jgi:hypothetical protein
LHSKRRAFPERDSRAVNTGIYVLDQSNKLCNTCTCLHQKTQKFIELRTLLPQVPLTTSNSAAWLYVGARGAKHPLKGRLAPPKESMLAPARNRLFFKYINNSLSYTMEAIHSYSFTYWKTSCLKILVGWLIRPESINVRDWQVSTVLGQVELTFDMFSVLHCDYCRSFRLSHFITNFLRLLWANTFCDRPDRRHRMCYKMSDRNNFKTMRVRQGYQWYNWTTITKSMVFYRMDSLPTPIPTLNPQTGGQNPNNWSTSFHDDLGLCSYRKFYSIQASERQNIDRPTPPLTPSLGVL